MSAEQRVDPQSDGIQPAQPETQDAALWEGCGLNALWPSDQEHQRQV